MSFAVRKDGLGLRAVASEADCAPDEYFSAGIPEPWPPIPVQEAQAKAARKAEILAQLSAIDLASARPLRELVDALASGMVMPDFAMAKAKLDEYDAQAKSLRAELAALG